MHIAYGDADPQIDYSILLEKVIDPTRIWLRTSHYRRLFPLRNRNTFCLLYEGKHELKSSIR